MKQYDPDKIRNIALVGHGGDGKTSLNEALLFVGGAITRLGKVDDGSSSSDHEPEEIKRKLSLSMSLDFVEWGKNKINLIDTPGDADFIPESMAALKVVDGLLFVVSAVSGLKVQMERIWGRADEYGLPRMVVVNLLDRERSDYSKTVQQLRDQLKAKALPLTIPVGRENSFNGVVDVLKEKAYIFGGGKEGEFAEQPIPEDMVSDATAAKDALIEAAAETDDALLEKFLEGGTLTSEEISQGLRRAVLSGSAVPVLAASASKVIGVPSVLSAIVDFMPSPVDRPSIKAKTPQGEEKELGCDPAAPFAALVFKTVVDPFAGRLTLFRAWSGKLSSDSSVFNGTKEAKERVGQVMVVRGKTQKPVSEVSAGDFGVMAKLKETQTGDTLCDESKPVILESLAFPKPIISFSLAPKDKKDEDKISTALHRLMEEDLTLELSREEQTKEWILSGMGQNHIEVTLDRLQRKFGVGVELHTPRVPYKETITAAAEAQGKYKKQTGGRGQYGDCWLKVEPLPRGGGYEFVNAIVGGSIPRQFVPAVDKGAHEALLRGILAGYPVVDVKVTCYDGSYHTVDSSEMAFKIAGSMGVQKAVKDAKPILLEPIMNLEVIVPEENVGDIIGDLNSRRGKIQGIDSQGGNQVVKAQSPLAELLKYAFDLRSMTGGRGFFNMEFSHYEQVPAHLTAKIVEESQQGKED